jgi:hypothetical protein
MADLPALSGSTRRKLAVQWDTIRDRQKLTDEDLSAYDRERQRLSSIAAKWPRYDPRHRDPRCATQVARWLAVTPSVGAAEARFRGIDSEYWLLWCSSGFGYEVYRDWLDSITRQISGELASIWKGRSDVTDRWFQGACGPAIEKALTALTKQRIAQAREVEMGRLDRKAPAEAWARTAEGGLGGAQVPASGGVPTAEPAVARNGGNEAGPIPQFPNRASWLKDRLQERSWNKHDVQRQGGPDRKTVQKILNGQQIREDVLEKLATALSKAPASKRLPSVTLLDIPRD